MSLLVVVLVDVEAAEDAGEHELLGGVPLLEQQFQVMGYLMGGGGGIGGITIIARLRVSMAGVIVRGGSGILLLSGVDVQSGSVFRSHLK